MKNIIRAVIILTLLGVSAYFIINKESEVEDSEIPEVETVIIENFLFLPETIVVPVGTTVRWINEDNDLHTVSARDFSSSSMGKGDVFDFTFTENERGIHNYICGFHPEMTGRVVVE